MTPKPITVFLQPIREVVSIEYGRAVTEIRDGPQDGKEIMRMAGVDPRDPVLMVTLQKIRADVSAYDFTVVQCKSRINYIASDHSVGFGEIVLIMAVGTSKGNDRGDGVPAATCPTGSLLVVGAARWHVA